jgi:hypothetical protein
MPRDFLEAGIWDCTAPFVSVRERVVLQEELELLDYGCEFHCQNPLESDCWLAVFTFVPKSLRK